MNKTFIFDLDDTLIENQIRYTLIHADFIKWVVERIGYRAPDARTIMNMEVEIDRELVRTMGFSRKRFPTSFKLAYRKMCKFLRLEDKEGEDMAYGIGDMVFDEDRWTKLGVGGMLEGTEDTLDFLASQKDELLLLSAGDREIQADKIRRNRLCNWFGEDKMYVVRMKSRAEFEKVVGKRDKENIWAVGNSIRSDVLPALEAGLKVVYIPCETWAYEAEHNGLPDDSRITTFSNIGFIKSQYSVLA